MAAFTPASKYAFPYVGFLDGTSYPAIGAGTSVVNVSSSGALTTALANATPGQRIVLASGTYSGAFTLSSKVGSVTNGISIEAASTGGAIFASGSTFTIKDCAHTTLRGLSFPYELSAAGNTVQFRGSSHHCRITRCLFGPSSVGTPGPNKTPMVYGGDNVEHIRVDHNEFRNKANPGNTILFDGNFTTVQVVKHIRIDHNYLHDIRPEVTNEKEPIRFGVSTLSKTFSYSVIERNVLVGCICEPENISVKASGVRVSGNTILRSIGGLVYRHGTDGVIADNHIVDRVDTFGSTIGSGGIRFYDANHEVIFNYVDSVHGGNFQSPLMLDSGDAEGNSTTLSAHWRVVNALVEGNVLVGNPEGIRFGHNYSLAPTGCKVQNNLVAQTPTGTAITQRIAPINTTQTNNLYGSTPPAIGLAQGSDTIWRRPDYGPGTTYLQPADVGITGDPNDTDGTGVLVGGNGGGGGPVTPGDPTSAADVLGWGAPLDADEFGYVGAPNSSKWAVYNSAGHAGNGRRVPARGTADGSKLVITGLSNGDSFGMEHRLNQRYGRWEVRCRSYPTSAAAQTLGVGGVAVPGGAITGQGSAGSRLTITTSGTSGTQRVYDGGGRTVGGITVAADYVTVQNFVIRGSARDGISSTGTGVILQNNDIALVHDDGTGDINGITFFGDGTKILYNSIGQNAFLVEGNPNGSHTDGIQTWNTPSQRSSSNVTIKGNWITGPAITDARYLHQGITAEGNDATSGGGGGTGNSATWTIDGNYFNTAGNQVLELRDIQGVVVTRNTFAGNASKVVNSADGSTVSYYSDNVVSGSYGSVGVSTTSGAGPGATAGGNYHPVLILWTDEVSWPTGGEIDFLENGGPGQVAPEAYWHYPHSASASVQQIHFTGPSVNLAQFHNFGIEWTPDGLVGYLDGVEWCRASGGANSIRDNIQDLRTAHLTIQLDNFGDGTGSGTNQIPATMEVEWVRVYSLTPTGSPAGNQTLAAAGIDSREAFGVPTATVPQQAPGNSVPTLLGQNLVLGTGTLGWTLTAGPPDPSGAQTLRPVGLPSGAAFGVPSFDVPPGDQTLAVAAIPPTTVFGLPLVGSGAAPPAAEGGVLVPALYAVGRDGTTLTPLTAWTKIHLSPVANSAGDITVDYPAGAPGFDLLQDSVSASPLRALEIRVWLGGSNSAALGGWLVSKSGDDLVPGSSWSFAGHYHEWLLTKAVVAPQTISEANKTGALTFAGATAGLIFATMMDQAQARGALPLVTRDFTSTHDSNGQPWAEAISSLKLAPKTTLAQVADKLVALGMVEYELTPARMWRAYNPGGRGVDRTLGASPLQFTPTINLRERARRVSSRDAGTAVLVAGAEGFYKFVSSPTAEAELGWRAEVGADAGQINSQSGVDAVAQAFLETARAGTAEYNSGVEFVPGQPLPLINYGVGDWAHVLAGTRYERLRIAQIELDFAQGRSPSGTVVQNDLITDKLTALYRRLNAIATGDAVVGTSTSTPGGAGEDVNPPAAPEGVTVASTLAYQVPGQTVTLAEVGVGWAAVTTNAYATNEIAAKAKAAPLIAAKLAQRLLGGTAVEFEEDWSWIGMPPIDDAVRTALLDEWNTAPTNDHGDENTRSQAAQTWLAQYATTHLGGGAITDDVAHYRVQFQYLGAQQVTTQGPRGEDPPDQLQPEGAWEEPVNSPTTQTTLVFGNVEGGRAVGVRVAAVDRANNQGPWSVVVAVDSASDDQPPPVPSKPVATAWFRTMDVFWDGKGSAGEDMLLAAPDFASGGGIEVHVDTGIDFLPDRPTGPTGKVDLSTSRTYQQTLYAAGTWNVVGLTVGTTYYARFVAVDRNGNASAPSATSDGVLPQQLVNIDIGPDAVGRLQIIDGEIVRAKIADAAINSLKVEEINVGLLRSGTMSANVIIGGRFTTPTVNGNKVEFDNAGIRLYQGNTVVGRWQVSDASMLVTGTYLSGLSGRRINILPSGTMIFYPDAGLNFGFIENLGGDLRMSGQTNQDQRAGYVLIDETRAALTYSQVATYNSPRTRFQVDPIAAASWAPIISMRINRSLDSDALGPRWLYTNFSTSGDIGTSIVHLQQVAAASNHAVLYGANSDAGIVFDAGFVGVVHNSIAPADVHASGFIQVSAVEAKRDIAPVRFGDTSARRLAQAARARSYYYRTDLEPRAERPGTTLRRFDEHGRDIDPVPGEWTHPQRRAVMHVGPMADDLLAIAPEIVHTDLPRHGGLGLNMGTVAGLAYAGVGELADEHDALVTEVVALRERLDRIDGVVIDGEVVDG